MPFLIPSTPPVLKPRASFEGIASYKVTQGLAEGCFYFTPHVNQGIRMLALPVAASVRRIPFI
jgi:hypothetical protein